MISNLLPPGFKDELFDQSSNEHKFKNIIINIFLSNGYVLVKSPLLEYANSINENNSFLIKVKSEKKEYILRSDITMQVARIASTRLKGKPRPLKLCYYGQVVRKMGSILRPEREFLQVGAECIGEDSYLADVEMLELAYQSLKAVGIRDITIELSSHVFLNYLFKNNKNLYKNLKFKSLIRKKDLKNSLQYIPPEFHNFTTNILQCCGEINKKKYFLTKLKVDESTNLAVQKLLMIYEKFKNNYPKVKFILDLTESDYLDYHKGTRFTIFAKNVRGEVARGGRYMSQNNSLIENSTGFNCYMDTILRASSKIQKSKKILIPFDTSISKKKELINKGYIIKTFFGDNRKIIKEAKKNDIKMFLHKNKIESINNK